MDILNINNSEIIYTSGSSEANNLAIKGIALKYQNRGKHIITTKFEHSSVYGPLDYLKTLGLFIINLIRLITSSSLNKTFYPRLHHFF